MAVEGRWRLKEDGGEFQGCKRRKLEKEEKGWQFVWVMRERHKAEGRKGAQRRKGNE